ncbi:hypothetical protein FO488_03500 [Geobacter sp. FeAm09]|uniref:hypothetical protein n=1 Tax=Geobacter sp. FeAm09 TaxID=2597769 RepID=UPI0011ECEC3F|nr:hypothetical protein [Geobacter sp. FeAm09]QEM67309.1 hypothetical protein FO488_03500 [Geobacter sp. FeAm09]
MKTIIHKLTTVIIPFIALTTIVTVSNGIAHRVERLQAEAMVRTEPAPEMLGNSIGAVMDNLFSGR